MNAVPTVSKLEKPGTVRWKQWLFSSVIVLLVLLSTLLPVFNSVKVSTRPHKILVLVTDSSGTPLRDATVYLRFSEDQHMKEAVDRAGLDLSDLNKWLRDGEHRLAVTDTAGTATLTGRFVTRWSETFFAKWGHYEPKGSLLVTSLGYKDREQSLASYVHSNSVSIYGDARVTVVLSPQ